MREFWHNAVPRQLPAQWAQETEQHEAIASLLGAYVDGELPAETMGQLDGHFAVCRRCSREVRLLRALAAGLGQTRGPVGSAALQTRIRQAVSATSAPPARSHPLRRGLGVLTPWRALALLTMLATGGFITTQVTSRRAAFPAVSTVAIDRDDLLDSLSTRWQALATQDLPGRARDLDAVRSALGVPVTPLEGPGLTLARAWTTSVTGELMGALAYRHDGRLLMQFIVPGAVSAPTGALRAALQVAPLVTASSDSLTIVVWNASSGMHVLVGPDSPDMLRVLATTQLRMNGANRPRP